MKKAILAGTLVLAWVAVSGCASSRSASTASVQQPEDITLTGSYLNHTIARNGLITDGVSPVLVIDNDMIRQSGASDAKEVLRRYGAGR